MKICIATPMYGGNCKGVYTDSLVNLVVKLAGAGHETMYSKIYNESLITRGRNALVHGFMRTDADALLFIDADHGFNPDHIVKMVESGKDLIGAIYPMKNINWDLVKKAVLSGQEDLMTYTGYFSANLLPGEININRDEPFELSNVGTGMMFITRKVFEDLKPHCATYAHHGDDGFMLPEDQVVEYFKTDIVDGILLSEDFLFCKMWQDIGGKVYGAPWVDISHFGEYEFKGNFFKSTLLKSILAERESLQETPSE